MQLKLRKGLLREVHFVAPEEVLYKSQLMFVSGLVRQPSRCTCPTPIDAVINKVLASDTAHAIVCFVLY